MIEYPRAVPMTSDPIIGDQPRMAPIFPGAKISTVEPADSPMVDAAKLLQGATNSQRKSGMAQKYPKYYKSVAHLNEVDIYLICELFKIEDTSGALHHSIKKLLLSGVRTGGKSKYEDIKEARDTLTRYLELYAPGMA